MGFLYWKRKKKQQDKKKNSDIKLIKDICDLGLIKDFLIDLSKFGRKFREEEKIRIKIKPCKFSNDLYIFEAKYSYYTTLISKDINFSFYRIRDTNTMEKDGCQKSDLLGTEFYWNSDERDFPENTQLQDSYLLKKCVIHGEIFKTKRTITDCKINYCGKVENVLLGKRILIEYTVEFPMETESYAHFRHELPTLKAEILLDYGEVADKINIFGIQVTSIKPEKRNTNYGEHELGYEYNGWMLPNHGIIFTWWKK
jgi:hypothetical protein